MKETVKGAKVPTFLFGILTVAICILNLKQPSFFTPTDIESWLPDFFALQDCLKAPGSISGCSALSKFPLAYLGVSAVLSVTSKLNIGIPLATFLLNLIFSLLALVLLVPLSPNLRNGSSLVKVCITLFLTPLPWFYLQSGAIEYQSGLLLILIAASFGYLVKYSGIHSVTSSKQFYAVFLLFASTFLFGLYKDSQSGLLLISLLAGLLLYSLFWHYRITTIWSTLVMLFGILASITASSAYNFYRYNDFLPRDYLHEALHRSPDIQQKFFNLLGIWFSLSGGVISFWGLSIIYVTTVVGLGVFKRLEVLITTSFFLVSSIALAAWWSPFGWFAWGNRLIIPSGMGFLFSLLLASFDSNAEESEEPIMLTFINSSTQNFLKLCFVILCAVTISCSVYYLIRPAFFSTRAKVFYEYHNASPPCQSWLHLEKSSKAGDSFWRSRSYYDCVLSRYWQPIQSW